MAVTSVSLLWTARGGKEGLDHHRTYTRQYEVITDNQTDDEQVVANAVGIPILGQSLGADLQAVVSSINPRQSDDSPYIWYVEVEYDTNPQTHDRDKPDNKVDLDGNTIDKTAQASPLDEPAVWTTTFEDHEEPAIEGIAVAPDGTLTITNPAAWATSTVYKRGSYVKNGVNVYYCAANTGDMKSAAAGGGPAGTGTGIADNNVTWNFYATLAQTQNDPNYAIRTAITNSGTLPFDPPVMVPASKLLLSVTKNAPICTMEYLLALKNAVNTFTWRGIPPRCAKVKNVTHDGGKEKNGIQYITTKWEISLDADTHDVRVLDQGFGRLQSRTDPATGLAVTKFVRFTDIHGDPLEQPVPMNGSGQALAPNDPPVFLRFVPRQTKFVDFNTVLPF